METQQKTLYKLYYLYLSDMRGKVDISIPVIGSFELEKLIEFYNKEKSPWKEESSDNFEQKHHWIKTFRKGSQLEWYNDVRDLIPSNSPDCFGGIGFVLVNDISVNIPII